MKKVVFNDSFQYGVEDLLANIVDDPDDMKRKVASDVRDTWGKMTPEKGRTLVHIIALGAFEKVGPNSNADAFEEEVCRRSHPDFIKKARLYRHHRKTAEDLKDGDVVRSAYNEKMGRVELVISAINEKCADWLGEIEKGNPVCYSMGWSCTDGDICSICGNRAHKRADYCHHLKKTAGSEYGLGKILPDGRQCFTFNRDGFWNDISYVDRGADMTAMDLCKIASVDPSCNIGGAELAEILGYCDDEKINVKQAFAIEIYNTIGRAIKDGLFEPVYTTGRISTKTANELSDHSPKMIFSYFKKMGCVMPFELFCDSLTSVVSQEAEQHIKIAKENFSSIAASILSDKNKLIELSKIGLFDSVPCAKLYLSDESELEILDKCSMSGSNGACEIAMDARISKTASDTRQSTTVANSLVEHYIAYKISAYSDKEQTKEKIFDNFVLN